MKSYLSILILFWSVLIVGCSGSGGSGGSGGNPDETPPPSAGSGLTSGVFLDSAAEGLQYLSGGTSGLTDANGSFQADGTLIQFLIGDILLGEGTVRPVMTPIDLVPGATDETNPTVSNITRLLLTLDDDGNPSNGIQISQAIRDAAIGKAINFSQSTTAFENDANVLLIIDELTALTTSGSRSLVSASDAQEHLSNTLLGILSFRLTVLTSGDGSGTVSSSPGGINCGVECSKIYADASIVNLTAAPVGDASFSGWEGDIDCADGVVTMTENKICIATFSLPTPERQTLTITRGGTSSGVVTDSLSGINCGTTCSHIFDKNTEITLTAIPSGDATFAGWSGDFDCIDGRIRLVADINCIATFDLPVVPGSNILTIIKDGDGTGSVTSSLAGIDCGIVCSANFSDTSTVTLTATPTGDAAFTGWRGDIDCSEGTVTMEENKTCVASFSSSSTFSVWIHRCTLLSDGTIQCSGNNTHGQLGNGTFEDSSTPVTVTGISTATAVFTGLNHSCALLVNETVQCWGGNWLGQLGNGTAIDSSIPVSVTGLSGVKSISSGEGHACALLSDGQVKCWGDNWSGQLGNGSFDLSNRPVTVNGLLGVTAISSSPTHSCALQGNGIVRCWGFNSVGQLGNGNFDVVSNPVSANTISTATAILTGDLYSCSLLENGTIKCWGGFWTEGGATHVSSLSPLTITGISTATAIFFIEGNSCALLANETIQCWGRKSADQQGSGTFTIPDFPYADSNF